MRRCGECGKSLVGMRPQAKFCGPRCRNRAGRKSKPAGSVVDLPGRDEDGQESAGEVAGGVAEAVRVELEAADRLGTSLGQAALGLARRIDRGGLMETGSAYAALVREMRATLAAATAGAAVADDPVDELRRRRERRRAGA